MGVPSFIRWLCNKYPNIVIECKEEKPESTSFNLDTTSPNPNGAEFDNLYLDLNTIIHECAHPEDKPISKNEEETMQRIFNFIDRMFAIVRPRKLFYIAIDGVAPRAKLNQQRSRRFKAALDAQNKQIELKTIRERILSEGGYLPPENNSLEKFDPNCITPGTPFMCRLAECLKDFINERLNSNPGWKDLIVILSDSNVPGEGEHKIMEFIRSQKNQPNYNLNTSHVLFSSDADLIMLGLATHEKDICVIREDFRLYKQRLCELCNQIGHDFKQCSGLLSFEEKQSISIETSEKKYIFLELKTLRKCLSEELREPRSPFEYDFERALDDWICLCFFVGNDFLPRLPSLEVSENAIDRLVNLYKEIHAVSGEYLTKSGEVNLIAMKLILSNLSLVEEEIFNQRRLNDIQFREKMKNKKYFRNNNNNNNNNNNKQMQKGVKNNQIFKTTANDLDKEEENDLVRLWEDGWKERYYKIKFNQNSHEFGRQVAQSYSHGLQWMFKYYYQSLPSWNWYYPYYYAPFASDFFEIDDTNFKFEKNTKPFCPFEQLMAIFPAACKKHVPEQLQSLMTDPDSPIIRFYPKDFQMDLNGKRQAWQAVALLPFVDEKLLKETIQPFYAIFSLEQTKRNKLGYDRLFLSKCHRLYSLLRDIYYQNNSETFLSFRDTENKFIAGRVWRWDEKEISDTNYTQVVSVYYQNPVYDLDNSLSSLRIL